LTTHCSFSTRTKKPPERTSNTREAEKQNKYKARRRKIASRDGETSQRATRTEQRESGEHTASAENRRTGDRNCETSTEARDQNA